jgi:hypothetical protein
MSLASALLWLFRLKHLRERGHVAVSVFSNPLHDSCSLKSRKCIKGFSRLATVCLVYPQAAEELS